MQIEFSVKDTISYNCFSTIMLYFCSPKCFHVNILDGSACISSPFYSFVSCVKTPVFRKHKVGNIKGHVRSNTKGRSM